MLSNFKKYTFLLLTVFLLIFSLSNHSPETLASDFGTLNFSNLKDLDSYNPLDGQWHFFPKELLSYDDIKTKLENDEGELVRLPNSLEVHTGEKNTFGTYVGILKIPKSSIDELLAIYIPYQYSAYEFYVNNKKIAQNGVPSPDKWTHASEMAPRIAHFTPESNELILTFHVSSFNHIRGGLENSIFLGNADTVLTKFNSNLIFSLFINGGIFVVGLLLLVLYLFQKRQYPFLIFGLFSIAISARALFSVPFYYTILFPEISWLWGTRLEYILTTASSALFIAFIWSIHMDTFSKKIMQLIVGIHIPVITLTLFTQPVFFQNLFFKVFYMAIPASIYIAYVMVKSIRNENSHGMINLIGISIILVAFFNDFFIGQNYYQGKDLMLIAVAIYVMLHVIILSKTFATQTRYQELLNMELIELNTSLDNKVIERTKQLKTANMRLKELAIKDGLTGIYNRSFLDQYIEQIFESIKDTDKEFVLLMIDIDDFKLYNDSYGHVQGDTLLKGVVNIIKNNLRNDEVFTRYGGEEFIIILDNINYANSLTLGERLRKAIAQEKFEHLNSKLGYVTISIGVAILSNDSTYESTSQWINLADKKLYKSKAKGKNCVN